MSRPDQRRLALQFSLSTVAWLACVFAWVSIVTFHVADWPSTTVWPQNTPPQNWCGYVGAWFAYQAMYYLGISAYAALLLATLALAAWTQRLPLKDLYLRFVGLALICVALSAAAATLVPPSRHFLVSGPGGVLGTAFAHFLRVRLQTPGTLIVLASGMLVGLILAIDDVMIRFMRWLLGIGKRSGPAIVRQGGQLIASAGASIVSGVSDVSGRLATAGSDLLPGRDDAPDEARPARRARQLALELDAEETGEGDSGGEAEAAREAAPEPEPPAITAGGQPLAEAGDEPEIEELPPIDPSTPPTAAPPRVTEVGRARSAPLAGAVPHRSPEDSDYELPSISLLEDPDPVDRESIEILCREKAYILEQTLNEFKLAVQVVAIETGPVITVFELKLAPGIKVSQIVSLSNDMARALKAPAVRVVAPLPGKNTIGIEVPNMDKEKVRLKDLMRHAPPRTHKYAIPLYLGKDASGQPLVSDLTRMPHLLIAGTTGSGKSVCVASIISSVLMTRTPEEVKLILVDPKVVELAMFKDIPHLMCPIVTEVSKAEGILDWAATKMDERYALLAEAGVKEIRAYNKLGEKGLRERMQIDDDEDMGRVPIHLPYIVIVIDELADLMMTSAKEVEFYLCRLAQKSRAVGIHLIVSTQRPQANVVTGLIKSNLPCRIAFRVSSRLDSRIVLDQNGAETLMGQGDMLFLPPGSAKLLRAQGAFVSDDELRAMVRHCRDQGEPEFHPELMRMPKAGGDAAAERDELFDQAVDIIIQTGRGSVSLLQRRLTIGYSRASRLVDQMYDAGIVGEYKGSQAREVLLTKEEWEQIRNARDREEAAEAAES